MVLSPKGETRSAKIERLLLSRRKFTSIGLECTRGGSTICHPELYFLASVPYASLSHSLFLVDCEGKGYGLAQFEKLPISLEEIPFHLMRHPGSAVKWQKLWLLKTFSSEQSRIFKTLKLSLKERLPILSAREIEEGLLKDEQLLDLLSLQDISSVKPILQKEFKISLGAPDILTVAMEDSSNRLVLAVVIAKIEDPNGSPEYDLQVVCSGAYSLSKSDWRKVGSRLFSHKHGFSNLEEIAKFLDKEFAQMEVLCLLRFKHLGRLYQFQRALNLIPGTRILGIENSRLVDRVLVKKIELNEEESTCVELSTGCAQWLLVDRFIVAGADWISYSDTFKEIL